MMCLPHRYGLLISVLSCPYLGNVNSYFLADFGFPELKGLQRSRLLFEMYLIKNIIAVKGCVHLPFFLNAQNSKRPLLSLTICK